MILLRAVLLVFCLSLAAAAQNRPFGPGEVLFYSLQYNGMGGGTSSQSVTAIEDVQGRRAYHIVAETKTNGFFDKIHKIRERRDAWLDADTLESLKITESVRQGSYSKETTTTLDPKSRNLNHDYKTTKHQGKTSVEAPPGVQDTVSVVYYLRTLPMEVGQAHDLTVHSGGELHKLRIEVKGLEKVQTAAGTFDAYHLVPAIMGEKKPKFTLEVWLTKDERRLPVLIKSKIDSGTIAIRLRKFTAGSA